MMDDKRFIKKIKNGDKKAFEELFQAYYHSIYLYCIRFTLDRDTAQELAQNVFVKFWDKRKKILISISLQAYLYKMAYNEFLMRKRTKDKEAGLIDRLTYEALQEYETMTADELKQKTDRVKKSIEKLPAACREILELKMSGLTYKEIARDLDISVKTVESQMGIAYKKLKTDLKDTLLLWLMLGK